MKRLLIALSVLLMFAGTAEAAQLAGVAMFGKKTVNGQALVLNGLGLREATVFKVDVYVAGLYLVKKSKNAKAILDSPSIKYLKMKFVRDVKVGKMKTAWLQGVRKNGGFVHLAHVVTLNKFMRSMKKGDEMSFTFTTKGVGVKVKKGKSGFIAAKGFARALLAVFIGKHPPNKGLKKGLLGK